MNSYLKFNGIDQYVTIPNGAAINFGTGDFSVSLWLKPQSGEPLVIDKRNQLEGLDVGIQLFVESGLLYAKAGQVGGELLSSTIPFAYSTESFIHLVVQRVSGDFVFYVNGTNIAATRGTPTGSYNVTTTVDMRLASGAMDDIRFYKSGLTTAEIAEIYSSGAGRKYAALSTGKVASWASDCDDGTGDTLSDAVGTLHVTLTGNVADNMWNTGGVPLYLSSTSKKLIHRRKSIWQNQQLSQK